MSYFQEFWTGSASLNPGNYDFRAVVADLPSKTSLKFRIFKVIFDYAFAIMVMPVIAAMSIILFFVNPWFNPGPIFFVQDRMGRDGNMFRMFKFRTMTVASEVSRDPTAALEKNRITRLGNIMRKTRLDELPNLINVLRGEMSVIGPRPDAYNHAMHFSTSVEGYKERHRVRPGITGLAQVEVGYAEGEEATAEKAKYDNIYVNRHCGRLDLYIIYRTFHVMVRGLGS